MRLQDAHVLVTGASRGLGEAIADAFSREGARLSLVGRDSDRLADVAARTGGVAHVFDLTRVDRLASLIADVQTASGPIDVLVNNAGIVDRTGFLESALEDVEEVLALDLRAPLALTRLVVPEMTSRANGGAVVLVSSIGSVLGAPGLSAYCAAKAGLSRFADALEMELRGSGVRITVAQFSNICGGGTLDACLSEGAYPQTRSYMRLAYRLGMTVDTSCAVAAGKLVRGVTQEKRRVTLPRRHAPFYAIAGVPSAVSRSLYARLAQRAEHERGQGI